MDRLDGEAQHASVTGAKPGPSGRPFSGSAMLMSFWRPAAPAGERLPLLEDGTPPMAPDPSQQLK